MTFTEYIEFFCRIAVKFYKIKNGDKECKLEYKVSEFIKMMFEGEGIADPKTAKLKNPEEEDMGYFPINDDEECC